MQGASCVFNFKLPSTLPHEYECPLQFMTLSSSLGQVPCIPVSETLDAHPIFTLSMVIRLADFGIQLESRWDNITRWGYILCCINSGIRSSLFPWLALVSKHAEAPGSTHNAQSHWVACTLCFGVIIQRNQILLIKLALLSGILLNLLALDQNEILFCEHNIPCNVYPTSTSPRIHSTPRFNGLCNLPGVQIDL